jgi:hypothetical protein
MELSNISRIGFGKGFDDGWNRPYLQGKRGINQVSCPSYTDLLDGLLSFAARIMPTY